MASGKWQGSGAPAPQTPVAIGNRILGFGQHPPTVDEIAAGSVSEGVTARGKKPGKSNLGVTGINDYTGWFAGDEDMKGDYGGDDGPCPPWHDALIHRYVFTIYALDIEALDLSGSFTGREAPAAMEGRIPGHDAWTGTDTLNTLLTST
ncbi:MAG: hypothetical protein QNK37_28390 [Acidobacteriota bacterium]|nr:hypothetical protein [Acidobacteriota bacterium]